MPMVTTPAVLTPDMAAMIVQMPTTAMAMPPLRGPVHWCMAVKRSSAMPDLSSTLAIKIKSGRATRIKLVMGP